MVNRFWRRGETPDEDSQHCPFCESPNPIGASQCAQCYYEFDKPAMSQPMATPTSSEDDLLSTLMSEIEETDDEEGPAMEVVLTMDEITVDVDQYEIDKQESESDEKFQFIESASPTLSSTVEATAHEAVEIEAKDAKANVEMFESNYDPLSEDSKPVAMKVGKVVTGTNDPGIALPALPGDELFNDEVEIEEPSMQVEPITGAVLEPEESTQTPVISEQRYWPWPASEAWDPRDVHRRVVESLEAVKSGKFEEAAKTIDEVGPHLDGQIELIYHVGLILKSVGRIDSMRWMLAQAARMHPDNNDVKTALIHLGTE